MLDAIVMLARYGTYFPNRRCRRAAGSGRPFAYWRQYRASWDRFRTKYLPKSGLPEARMDLWSTSVFVDTGYRVATGPEKTEDGSWGIRLVNHWGDFGKKEGE